jgi:hypothetical protein
MSEIRELQGPDNEGFKRLLKFALVNTRDGRIVISHVGQLADREYASGGKPVRIQISCESKPLTSVHASAHF